MKISLGEKIKQLRKARGITQGQLAEALDISFQAISKWENGIALPDITLVPALASYFGVTTDELFDFNLSKQSENVLRLCREAYKYRDSDTDKSRAMLEDALKQYPDDDIILNNMLYVIDYEKNPDEMITAAGRLIEKTNDGEVKCDALRFLAYAYNQKGDTASAVAALEQIPELYFTRQSELAYILKGKAKFDAASEQKWISFDMFIHMMCNIADYYATENRNADALHEYEKALEFISMLRDELNAAWYEERRTYIEGKLKELKK